MLNLRPNVFWAIGEVLVAAGVLFFLTKIIVANLGVEALGVWSLVFAATALVRAADVGLASGIARFVAMANAETDGRSDKNYLETAIVTNAVLFTVLAAFAYYPVMWGVGRIVSSDYRHAAIELVPVMLLNLVFSSTAAVASAGLVGQQKAYQKSIISILGYVLQCLIAGACLQRGGLLALGWAQVVQNVFLLLVSWIVFLRNQRGRGNWRLPWAWSRAAFNELFRFGIALQSLNIVNMLYEPLVKLLMAKLFGMQALGIYEMASRLVQQARQVAVMPASILVPAFVDIAQKEPDELGRAYHKSVVVLFCAGAALFLSLGLLSPLISYIWIGSYNSMFVSFTVVLAIGWFANLVAVPAYLLGISQGQIWWNFWGHVLTTFGAPILGMFLGSFMGATGVVAGAAAALAVGSILVMIKVCGLNSIGLADTWHFAVQAQERYLLKRRLAPD